MPAEAVVEKVRGVGGVLTIAGLGVSEGVGRGGFVFVLGFRAQTVVLIGGRGEGFWRHYLFA